MREMLVSISVLVLFAFVMWWLIPAGIDMAGMSRYSLHSAAFWPTLMAAILVLLSALLVLQNIVRRWRHAATGRPSADQDASSREAADQDFPVRMVIAVCALVPYYLLLKPLGLLLPSALAFLIFSLLAGEHQYRSVVLWSIGVPVVTTLFFMYVGQVLIPLGPLSPLFK